MAIPPPRLEAKPAAVNTAKANPEAEELVNTTNAKPKAKERVNTTKKPRSADRHKHPNRDRQKPGYVAAYMRHWRAKQRPRP